MNIFSKCHVIRVCLYTLLIGPILGGITIAQTTRISGTVTGLVEDPATGTYTVVPMPHMIIRASGKESTLYFWGLRTGGVTGWTMGTEWNFGTPLGRGSNCFDPLSGATGNFVYGNNFLTGDYTGQLNETNYLTTAPIDCTGMTHVRLRFKRWLGVAGRQGMVNDNAVVEVSNDGEVWDLVWMNPQSPLCDQSWQTVEYDISATADNQSTVYIRWGIGPNNNLFAPYCGWNIDDIELLTYINGQNTVPTGMDGAYTVEIPWIYNDVTSAMEGLFCKVNYDYILTNLEDSRFIQQDVEDGAVVDIAWDDTLYQNVDEVNVYWHINRLHDHLKAIDPTFTLMDYPIPVVLSRDGFGWDPLTGIITFRIGDGSPYEACFQYTLATMDKIYQGLDVSQDLEYPAMRIAIADYYACSMTGATIPTSRRDTDWSNEAAQDAHILTSALLSAAEQAGYDIIDELVHFARLDRPRNFNQFLNAMILRDDQRYGDNKVQNASPHADAIFNAFGNSGIGGLQFVYGSLKVIDESGDNDGLLEPGETAMLQINLQNRWADATDIIAELSSPSETLTITDAFIEFGNSSYGVEASNPSDVFEVYLSDESPLDLSIPLTITITASGPYEYLRECQLRLTIGSNQFFYDDGDYDESGEAVNSPTGVFVYYPMAAKFTPQTYPYTVEGVRILPGFVAAQGPEPKALLITIWDDNGFDGGPGAVLGTKEVEVHTSDLNSWYDVDLSEFELQIAEGGMYVGWSTLVLGGEAQPIGYVNHFDYDPPYYNQTYAFIDDVWTKSRVWVFMPT